MRTQILLRRSWFAALLLACGLLTWHSSLDARAQSSLSPDFAATGASYSPSARAGREVWFFATAFNDADLVYVAPVYAAGEAPVEGVNSTALTAMIKQRGHHGAHEVADAGDLADKLAAEARPGDMIVCLGAGDITKWAAGLAGAIEARRAA